MKAFFAAVRLSVKTRLKYRGTYIITFFADPVYFIINFSLLSSIYSYNKKNQILGYSFTEMLWYFAAIAFTWYFIYNCVDRNISNKVLSGDLISDLQRPMSLFEFELASALSGSFLKVIFNFIPSLIAYSIFVYPNFLTWLSLFRFAIVVSFAFLIFFEVNYLLGLASFIIKSNYSIQGVKFFLISLASGAMIPLEFFPAWVNRILRALPFQYLFYWPIQFFLNRVNGNILYIFMKIILIQMFWCVVLYKICKISESKALKYFCAVGG